ncbi:uncharacterized protein [Cherax quadricarinatus]|uniref:uncharacterized protein isoform X1 n=1 Tax=Cherax quadricarinatus TaxID=27406 RepID=UPI0023796A3F|nr:uncharacterized protein LOC128700513 isoform X1 [Cherax quadricarinatus]
MFTGNKMSATLSLLSVTPVLCSDALAKEEVQNLLKEDFDLVLLSVFISDCFLSLIYQMKVPFVYVNPAGLMGPFSSMIGNPRFPSYDASPMLDYKHPMTLMQRAISTLSDLVLEFLFSYIAANRQIEKLKPNKKVQNYDRSSTRASRGGPLLDQVCYTTPGSIPSPVSCCHHAMVRAVQRRRVGNSSCFARHYQLRLSTTYNFLVFLALLQIQGQN